MISITGWPNHRCAAGWMLSLTHLSSEVTIGQASVAGGVTAGRLRTEREKGLEARLGKVGQRIGDGQSDDFLLWLNSGLPTARGSFYGFGGYSHRKGNSSGFFRRQCRITASRSPGTTFVVRREGGVGSVCR